MSDDDEEFGERLKAGILTAYGLKPWHVGLAPVPRRVRFWRVVTLARLRVRLSRTMEHS